MQFLRRMLQISWITKRSNETVTVLREADTTRSLIYRIRKRQTTFIGHMRRREKIEYLVTTRMIIGKRIRGKQREKKSDGLTKRLKVGRVAYELKVTSDKDPWKVITAFAKE